MPPRISVLMPVYNAERYLAASLESILSQSMKDFEFVIVNDGSKDGSLNILKSYAEKDSRIRLISRPNTGIVGALNDGLAICQGEFIARMDGDDKAMPDRLEKQLAFMQANPKLVAAGTFVQIIDDEDAPIDSPKLPATHEEIEATHLTGDSSIYHPSVMIRTCAIRQVGGYREGTCPCEDYDLYLRLGEMGELANMAIPLLKYRRSATSIVSTQASKISEARVRVLRDAFARRGIQGEARAKEFPLGDMADFYRQWGWLALQNGYHRTARKYAIRSLLKAPFKEASWRLAYCVARGR